uniref:Uncharacterized protein n=1 Tax=Chromera velia CCMP2878 TaxID=1169474 RepID=A0A0G4I4K2_9ALVE|eukprot:Cvel_1799.t1-p1 / transcript=Cvel_1799.t1 / gene=Cvel_1799 / organism=Chromera_velia_CCMP2878 / gene_product=hypothetical protein / transcript_product=hypothetical protein / location=Cvel_scaffold66:58287-60172(-) / protein_length=196 / sequence_SO=supercontig / SO=protein_coding / is_pseudo=false
MRSRSPAFRAWWARVKLWAPAHSEAGGAKMLTVTEFKEMVPEVALLLSKDPPDVSRACELMFEKMLELFIGPAFTEEAELEAFDIRFERTFRRYMIGQAHLFFHFSPVLSPSEWTLFDRIDELMKSGKRISVDQAAAIRGFFSLFLERLRGSSLLTDDDVATFRQVYPLFEPLIVSYDSELEEDHRAFALRILEGS